MLIRNLWCHWWCLILCCPFSSEMSWMESGTELSQFLSIFLPTLVRSGAELSQFLGIFLPTLVRSGAELSQFLSIFLPTLAYQAWTLCLCFVVNLPVHSLNALIVLVLRDCLPNYFSLPNLKVKGWWLAPIPGCLRSGLLWFFCSSSGIVYPINFHYLT